MKLIGEGNEIHSNRGPRVYRGLIARTNACGTNNGLNTIFPECFKGNATARNLCLVIDPKAICALRKRYCGVSRNSNASLTEVSTCTDGNVFDAVFSQHLHKALLRLIFEGDTFANNKVVIGLQ